MDTFSRKKRSQIMRMIRSKETGFERGIFRELRATGLTFQTNYTRVIGRPDIAKPKHKKAVLLHSDFWHGWQYSRWSGILPNTFWKNKIVKNRLRDRKVLRSLKRLGWRVLVLWEHTYKREPTTSITRMHKFLK